MGNGAAKHIVGLGGIIVICSRTNKHCPVKELFEGKLTWVRTILADNYHHLTLSRVAAGLVTARNTERDASVRAALRVRIRMPKPQAGPELQPPRERQRCDRGTHPIARPRASSEASCELPLPGFVDTAIEV